MRVRWRNKVRREVDEKSRTGRKEQKGNESAVWVGGIQARQQTAFPLIGDAGKHVRQKWKRKVTGRHIKHGVGCKCEAEKTPKEKHGIL